MERNHDFEAAGFDIEEAKLFDLRSNGAAADLFDYAYPMIRVDDFVTDAKRKVIHDGRAAPQRQLRPMKGTTSMFSV